MTERAARGGLSREVIDFARTLAIAIPPIAAGAWTVLAPAAERSWGPIGAGVVGAAIVAAFVRSALVRRLRTVASVLAAYREGDFSIRAREKLADTPLDDVLREVNQLGDMLREHRLGEIEAWALLRKVMGEVDVVVLAFDADSRVKLVNDAGARLLGQSATALAGVHAKDVGLESLLAGDAPRIVRDVAVIGASPWELRRGAFRLSGEPHSLVVLSDVSSALREQEREAWKRLIRVMGHEINNSLAPLQSISDNLGSMLARSPKPEGWEEDVASGLSVIARRSEALGRFMTSYAQLARLPAPKIGKVDVGAWVERTVALEQRLRVTVTPGPDVTVDADPDQLDQLLINLVKNAVDATLEKKGSVRVGWRADPNTVDVIVEDEGPGVAETANLFVPFFTTKPGGSGIGLALAQQIAEAHGGSVSLETKKQGVGAIASVHLRRSGRPTTKT